MGEAIVPEPVKRLIAEKNSLLNQIGEMGDEIERLRRELAQIVSQFSDNVELQEAEQRGFERGRAYERETDG